MNIGCDGRALVGPRTGVGVWTERIAGGLAMAGAGKIHLAATRAIELADEEVPPGLEAVPPPRRPVLGPVWLNTAVPRLVRSLELDVWIGSLAILPVRCPAPMVAMVHDLTPLTVPSRHTLRNRLVFRLLLKPSLRVATVVVAGTAATAEEVRTAYPWVEDKMIEIGYGVDEWYSPAPEDDDGSKTRRRFSAGRPYILHLGTLEPRKGIQTVVEAWERLGDEQPDPPDLVIAGGRGWGTGPILDRIRSSTAADRIHLPGYVERSDARDLLRHAEVFVLASEAEGFGLPLAESISCGTPAVASDLPVLREAAGSAAVFCRVGDPLSFSDGLRAALDPDTAGELRRTALERASGMRWGPVVDRWAELVRRVVAAGAAA